MSSVRRLERPSRNEFLYDIVPRQQPVVITGGMRDWSDVPLGSVERFADGHGSLAVDTQLRWGPKYGQVHHETMELDRFVELMRRGEECGKRGVVLARPFSDFPELESRLRTPEYLPRGRRTNQFLFLTPEGFVSALHYDVCHNLLALFCGRKRVLLIPPRYARQLHHPPPWKQHFWASPIDAEQPDLERYPAFAHVPRYECLLEPTEMLFIPGGWRHHVRGLQESIAVAFFWEHSLEQWLTIRALRLLGGRGKLGIREWLGRKLRAQQ
jgi:hypothetical protein